MKEGELMERFSIPSDEMTAKDKLHQLALQYLNFRDDNAAYAAKKNCTNQIILLLISKESPLFAAQAKKIRKFLSDKKGYSLFWGAVSISAEELNAFVTSEVSSCLMEKTLPNWGKQENDNFFAFHLKELGFHLLELTRRRYAQLYGCAENQLKDHKIEEGTKLAPSTEEILYSEEPSGDVLNARMHSNMQNDEDVQQRKANDAMTSVLEAIAGVAKHRVRKDAANYPLLFATEFTVRTLRISYELGVSSEFSENDIMQNIDTEFLDYFESEPCRSTDEIAVTRLKTYGDFPIEAAPENQKKEIRLPLEGFVYTTYLNVSAAAVSQQKTKYEEMFRKLQRAAAQ